jgi:hypothetical protein
MECISAGECIFYPKQKLDEDADAFPPEAMTGEALTAVMSNH